MKPSALRSTGGFSVGRNQTASFTACRCVPDVAVLFSSSYALWMSVESARPQRSPPELLEAYRAAAVAYRAAWRADRGDLGGRYDGREAVKKIRPELPDDEAMRIVTRAVAYTAMHRPKWFWKR
jgi:hypothetical protein